jgi:glyoxylate carboligase
MHCMHACICTCMHMQSIYTSKEWWLERPLAPQSVYVYMSTKHGHGHVHCILHMYMQIHANICISIYKTWAWTCICTCMHMQSIYTSKEWWLERPLAPRSVYVYMSTKHGHGHVHCILHMYMQIHANICISIYKTWAWTCTTLHSTHVYANPVLILREGDNDRMTFNPTTLN